MTNDTKPAGQPLFVNEDEAESEFNNQLVPLAAVVSVARKPGRKVVTTLTLSSRTCKWPIGDPAASGFHYCGVPPQSGRPYCDEHDRMSYQATPRKKPSTLFR